MEWGRVTSLEKFDTYLSRIIYIGLGQNMDARFEMLSKDQKRRCVSVQVPTSTINFRLTDERKRFISNAGIVAADKFLAAFFSARKRDQPQSF